MAPFPVKVQNYKGVGAEEGEEPPHGSKNMNFKVNVLISVPHSTVGRFQLKIICGEKNPKDSNLLVTVKKRLWVSAPLSISQL